MSLWPSRLPGVPPRVETEHVGTGNERGTLRVYLGAAPGVGKTYKMLEEGHRRAARGTDVVVGFVETHGRPHTEAMLGDLEIVPRKTVPYRGATFTEMDLDAVLTRRPDVVKNSVLLSFVF